MRPIFERCDHCSYLIVAVIATIVARAAHGSLPRFRAAMGWAATAALLFVAAEGYVELQPTGGDAVFAVVVVAWIGACAAALLTAILLPPLAPVWDAWRKLMHEREIEARQQARKQEEEWREEQRRAAEER